MFRKKIRKFKLFILNNFFILTFTLIACTFPNNDQGNNLVIYSGRSESIVDEILKDQENEMKKTIKKLFILASIKPIEILTEKIKKVNGNFELFYDEIKELLQEHDENLF